jgi:RNA polymerase-binding transcription factor DksA
MKSLSARKEQLLARQAVLEERLETIDDELKTHNDPDWDDQAAKREGDEVLEGVGVSGQHELGQIKAALERIEAGSYGQCARCGDEISQDRLDLLPATPFCRNCAE